MESLRRAFTPEFLGRLDRIVCFRPLTAGSLEAVAGKYLTQLQERLASSGIRLQLPEELKQCIAAQCKPKDGARHIRRLIQQQVEGPLADHLLRTTRKGKMIRGVWTNGVLKFQE